MGRHLHGGDTFRYPQCMDFSANCNPLGTPLSVKEAVIKSLDEIRDYPAVGCMALRQAIAEREGLSPEDVICTNGAAELIFLLCQARKPKRALLTAPSFAEYHQALQSVDCLISFHALSPRRDFRLERDYLESLNQDLDIAFLCNPNNPNGLLIDPNLLEEICESCRQKDILLVVDECFLDFTAPNRSRSLVKKLKDNPGLVLLRAFTKAYGMAGLRLGYGLCSDHALLACLQDKAQPWNVSTPAQAAGLAALGEEDFVQKGREITLTERERLSQGLQDLGFLVYPSEANYILFQGPPGLKERLASQGFLIRDCSNYEGLKEGYYRIAVRLPEENKALLAELKKSGLVSTEEG